MTDPNSNPSIARRAGYYIRQGAYQGTADDRLGRWYVGRHDTPYRPYGAGFATQRAAWEAAADLAREMIETERTAP